MKYTSAGVLITVEFCNFDGYWK